jgi:hypothetical protein
VVRAAALTAAQTVSAAVTARDAERAATRAREAALQAHVQQLQGQLDSLNDHMDSVHEEERVMHLGLRAGACLSLPDFWRAARVLASPVHRRARKGSEEKSAELGDVVNFPGLGDVVTLAGGTAVFQVAFRGYREHSICNSAKCPIIARTLKGQSIGRTNEWCAELNRSRSAYYRVEH